MIALSPSDEGGGRSRVRGDFVGSSFGEKRGVVHLGPCRRAVVPQHEDGEVGKKPAEPAGPGGALALLLWQ